MSFCSMKFSDFITLQRGHDLTKEQFVKGEYPVVSSTTIMGYHNEYKAKAPGVVIGRSGTLGEVQYVCSNYWPHNTSLYVKEFKGNYPKFVYYFLKNFGTETSGGGSAVPTLNRNNLNVLDICVPDLATQKSIADILSTYDDLIENNQKQIKLLEEAAQRLYKEWFVDLRFPGHKNTPIIDGVPQGWRKTQVREYLTVRSGFAFKSSWWQSEGHPVVKIKDINNNTVDLSSIDFVSAERTEKIPEFRLSKGDVVIAMTGATIGKIGIVPDVENLYTNQRVGKIFPKECIKFPTPFIFCFYSQDSVLEQIIALSSSSSAQPNISGHQLDGIELISNLDIINLFCEKIMPLFDKIINLRQQIDRLIQARDRLLPKLMSGEIEV